MGTVSFVSQKASFGPSFRGEACWLWSRMRPPICHLAIPALAVLTVEAAWRTRYCHAVRSAPDQNSLEVLNMRIERDLLGEKAIPDDVYYGVQTARALEN